MAKVVAVASLVVTVLSLVGCAAEPEVEADSSGAAQTSGDRERLDVTSSEIDEVSHARPGADAVRAERGLAIDEAAPSRPLSATPCAPALPCALETKAAR